MSDPILAMLLANAGCPYEEGSLDSAIWIHGFRTGLAKAQAAVDAEAYRAAKPPLPIYGRWESPQRRTQGR